MKIFSPADNLASSGHDHSACVSSEGLLYTFGCNSSGQLGLGDCRDRNKPCVVPGLENIKFVTCGFAHTIAIDSEGICWAFGNNEHGQLGVSNSGRNHIHTSQQVTTLPPIQSAACGKYHTMFLDTNGCLYATGRNGGALGFKKPDKVFTPVQVSEVPGKIISVSCGAEFTMIVNEIGNVYATGKNSSNLGTGKTTDIYTFTKCPTLKRIVFVSCGLYHSVFLSDNGCVFILAQHVRMAKKVSGLANIKAVASQYHGCCFVNEDNVLSRTLRISSLVGGARGSITVPYELPEISIVSRGGNILIAKDIDGNVWVSGPNTNGALGLGNTGTQFDLQQNRCDYILGKKPTRLKSARK